MSDHGSQLLRSANMSALLLIIVILTSVAATPVLQPFHEPRVSTLGPTYDPSQDLGEDSLAPTGLDKKQVVLVLSDCSQCNIGKIESVDRSLQRSSYTLKVLIGATEDESALQDARDLFPNISIAALTSEMARDLNVAFYPRLYQVDEGRKMQYVQPPNISFYDALKNLHQ